MIPDRVPLILAPTPMHRLPRISAELGIELWIKRDDLTGFALGGNKGRKLEYFMADAFAQKAEVVVTCGALQSNFVRQLGAAGSMFDLSCAAAVMELPYEHAKPSAVSLRPEGGNALLDRLLGIDLRLAPDGSWTELYSQAEALAQEFEGQGKRVYRIPVGGSSPLGAFAFVQAAQEVKEAGERFDWIVFASSSGSTQVGLAHEFAGSDTRVLGIACDPEPTLVDEFAELGVGLAELIGASWALKASDFELSLDYVGPGYGVPSTDGDRAIELLARREGIFLDPIYSGKAFAGLIDLAEKRQIGGKVLFWHTGGVPALFATG